MHLQQTGLSDTNMIASWKTQEYVILVEGRVVFGSVHPDRMLNQPCKTVADAVMASQL